jgi:hypothetical protein
MLHLDAKDITVNLVLKNVSLGIDIGGALSQ